ncbi:MAG: hypothetical protein US49_C0002G0095 [candidate division TM6 bacterium GW2011_GWF2_37_49]|nr:MAG: hypothetical protein US49_C0002G0095 [candidate division TM6 bacterium GW2011_GWF2_37_49]
MMNKNVVFSAIIMAVGVQFSVACMDVNFTPDVRTSANNLRNVIKSASFSTVNQFMETYLKKAPASLPDIFWCTKGSLSFERTIDKDFSLFDIMDRAREFNDHEQVLNLMTNALVNAYWHKGHTQQEINQLLLQWLWAKNREDQYFLEYCVLDGKCNNDIKRKIVRKFITLLQRFAPKSDEPVWMLASTAKSGHIIYAHCEDLFKNELAWLKQFRPSNYSSGFEF